MRRLFLLLAALPLGAQIPRFQYGVTGGAGLNNSTHPAHPAVDESRRYTFGPVLEVSLVKPITVSLNPLYKRTGWSYGPSGLVPEAGALVLDSVRSRSHRWELPVMGKYLFRVTRNQWRPFLGSGFAFRTEWNTSENRLIFRDAETNVLRESMLKTAGRSRVDTGVVVSAGIAFRQGRIQFVPELRYTRWGNPNRHQGDVLFSIRF